MVKRHSCEVEEHKERKVSLQKSLGDDQQVMSSINNNQQDNTCRMKPDVREL